MSTRILALSLASTLLGSTGLALAQAPAAVMPNPGAAPATAPAATRPAAPGAPSPTTPAPTSPVVEARSIPQATNPVLEAFRPQSGGLTANEVARRAVATSDTLVAKNAELRAAAAQVDSALYKFLPQVTLNATYARLSRVEATLGGGYSVGASAAGPLQVDPGGGLVDTAGNPVGAYPATMRLPVILNNYSLTASLGVPISDYLLRLSNSIKATKANRDASALRILAERQKVEADARVAFYNWSKAIGQVAVTEKSIDRVKARLKDVQAAFTVGSATRAEVLRLEALVATTEAGLETARAFRELAAQQLAVIMDARSANFTLGEDVLAPPQDEPPEPTEKLVAEAQRRRHELLAVDRTIASLQHAEKVIRAGRYPRLDGFADYTYANPNQRYYFSEGWNGSWTAGLQLSWTLNNILTEGSSAEEMSAQREALIANRRAIVEGLRLEIMAAQTDVRRASAELEAARRAAEASQAAYDTSVQLYRVGRATTADLIDSEAELVNSLLRLVTAHIDTRLAQTKLTHAVGRELSKIKG